MNKNFLFLALGCAMLMTSCVKDEPNAYFIKLFAEGFTPDGSASKAAVSGDATYWVAGDDLWINNYRYEIIASGGEAVASGVHQEGEDNKVYRAVYPVSAHDGAITSDNITINVPNEYIYRESEGKQVLDGLPMVAYHSGSDPEGLNFKHVTAAITVRVKNVLDKSIDLSSIELINDVYKLSGTVPVNLSQCASDGTPTITAQTKTGDDNRVTITFVDVKTIVAGGYVDIQIPILPVGDANSQFTVKINAHNQGVRYAYSRTQSGARDNTIERGYLGYATARYESEEVEVKDLFDVTTEGGKDYYEISSPDDLANLSNAMKNGWTDKDGEEGAYKYANYKVTSEIDFQGATISPIHFYNQNGTGECVFDGGGNLIHNVTFDSGTEENSNACGFFAGTDGENIKVQNLNLQDANFVFHHRDAKLISYDDNYTTSVGGVFGVVDKPGVEIVNCTISHITIGCSEGANPTMAPNKNQCDYYASGLVGLCTTELKICSCYVGTVEVENNEVQAKLGNMVDQFGAAVGRWDVGDKNSSNSYATAGANAPLLSIDHFTYDQGSTQLTFIGGLRNIRYGGIIANVTRGGILRMTNCSVKHNLKLNGAPTTEMYVAGVVGCFKNSLKTGFYMKDCTCCGTIENQAISGYTNSFQINKFYSLGPNLKALKDSETGGETETATQNSCSIPSGESYSVTGQTTSFKNNSQTFSFS